MSAPVPTPRLPPATGRVGSHPLAMADPALAAVISHGQVNHVVKGVVSSYTTATKAYLFFCSNRELQPWPVDDVKLAGFIHIICQRISTQSLKMYLSGIRYSHENEYGRWRLSGNELVRRTIRYVRRLYPSANDMSKLPVTLSLLRQLFPFLPGWPVLARLSRDDLAFAVASVVAVSAFLRGGEVFTYPSSSRPVLLRSSLSLRWIVAGGASVEALVVSVPQPKTQWELPFVDVPCFSCPEAGPFSPVVLWKAWCERFPCTSSTMPAFSRAAGGALTRDFMVSRTADLMVLAQIPAVDSVGKVLPVKAASWRAGAVRSAMDAGLSETMIMEYGRWKSVAWRHYLMHTPYDLLSASVQMVRASVACPGGVQRVGGLEAAQLGAVRDEQMVRSSERSLRRRSPS
jgi:hypothetical protein